MLNELQRALEIIYGVDAPHRVEEFVVERGTLVQLGASVRAEEELFVLEAGEGMELALFISPEILDELPGLGRGGPARFLDQLLPAFTTAAEGVSHFVYLTLQALRARTVSLLELEVQAEVDKFVTSALYLWKHGERRRSSELRERLFDRVGYRGDLSAAERERYGLANRLGRGYAAWLESRFIVEGRLEELIRELRRTYRLGSTSKFEYLAGRA